MPGTYHQGPGGGVKVGRAGGVKVGGGEGGVVGEGRTGDVWVGSGDGFVVGTGMGDGVATAVAVAGTVGSHNTCPTVKPAPSSRQLACRMAAAVMPVRTARSGSVSPDCTRYVIQPPGC